MRIKLKINTNEATIWFHHKWFCLFLFFYHEWFLERVGRQSQKAETTVRPDANKSTAKTSAKHHYVLLGGENLRLPIDQD